MTADLRYLLRVQKAGLSPAWRTRDWNTRARSTDDSTADPSPLMGHSVVMEVAFSVDGQPATFRRNAITGTAELVVGGEVLRLQSPYRFETHWTVNTRRTWQTRVGRHEVEVAMTRPRAFGGIRSKAFVVSVDGEAVAEGIGL